MKALFSVLFLCVLSNVAAFGSDDTEYAQRVERISDIRSQVGKFCVPQRCYFFHSTCIRAELKRILGDDFEEYLRHLAHSGSSMLTLEGDTVSVDVSQLHVGGFTSLLYFDLQKETIVLFWMRAGVLEQDHAVYGDKPVRADILDSMVSSLNSTWGHVAEFSRDGQEISIIKTTKKIDWLAD
ncbi:hypothetical protein [Ruficoccus sp. ZRK36]|uniref:hypothetical protein n=1 Tax=Ruficoccus sp. ZRK36 TaxID=2866311 RepID=UPI001C72F264|nr:hypothetical protein [Ruficoccus sp. ZRK36]QYY37099.1 hypothetical protein K0V07_06355 [Ruficoccus sp. ZRK36]